MCSASHSGGGARFRRARRGRDGLRMPTDSSVGFAVLLRNTAGMAEPSLASASRASPSVWSASARYLLTSDRTKSAYSRTSKLVPWAGSMSAGGTDPSFGQGRGMGGDDRGGVVGRDDRTFGRACMGDDDCGGVTGCDDRTFGRGCANRGGRGPRGTSRVCDGRSLSLSDATLEPSLSGSVSGYWTASAGGRVLSTKLCAIL